MNAHAGGALRGLCLMGGYGIPNIELPTPDPPLEEKSMSRHLRYRPPGSGLGSADRLNRFQVAGNTDLASWTLMVNLTRCFQLSRNEFVKLAVHRLAKDLSDVESVSEVWRTLRYWRTEGRLGAQVISEAIKKVCELGDPQDTLGEVRLPLSSGASFAKPATEESNASSENKTSTEGEGTQNP